MQTEVIYYCRICKKIPHLPKFPMLFDLLSDAYLIFHIKINDDSCDLLFQTHFMHLNWEINLIIQVLNIKSLLQ